MKLQAIKDHGSHYWATAVDGARTCRVIIATDMNARQWYISGPNDRRHYIAPCACARGAIDGAKDRVRTMGIDAMVAQ